MRFRTPGPFLARARVAPLLVAVCTALLVACASAGSSWAQAAAGDSVTVAAPGADTASLARPARPPYVMPPLREGLFDEMHNKLVHFPIVLALSGLVLLGLSGRRPELLPIAHAVIWLAAASAVAAYFSGRFQEEKFEGRPKEWLAELHERSGTVLTLASGAWAVLVGLQPSRRLLALIWGVVVAAMTMGTAYLGGVLAHGH